MVLARSFNPGPERDRRIKQACRERECTPTSFVNDAIDTFLDINDLDDDESDQQAVTAARQPREIVKERVRPATYVIDARGKASVVIDGEEYKYCEKCKKYYRFDENGSLLFYGELDVYADRTYRYILILL